MIVNRTPMLTETNNQSDGHFSGRFSTRSYKELVSKKAVHAIKYQNVTKITYSITDTAISRKVVGKSPRDNPERYCGWFRVLFFSKKFERIGTKGHGNVFAGAKGKQEKQV